MSISRKLFRPMAGQTHGRFAAFRMNGTLSYRGDTVFLDTTANATQGQTAGVLDGATLGLNDFMYVQIAQVATTGATIGHYKVAGVVEGLRVGDRNTTTAIPDDGVVIVQVAGVHQQTWMSVTTGVADWIAVANSNNTLGAALPLVGLGVSTDDMRISSHLLGVIMGPNVATGTRAAVTTTSHCPVWVRCGDLV